MGDSNCKPRGARESQIFANIKVLLTRFGVVDDGMEVDSYRSKECLGGRSILLLTCKRNWRDLNGLELVDSSQRLEERVCLYTRQSFKMWGESA